MNTRLALTAAIVSAILAGSSLAQQKAPCAAQDADTSYIDANGTTHVTRVVPVPQTISQQAQKWLATAVPDQPDTAPDPDSMRSMREAADKSQAEFAAKALALYPANVSLSKVAGIPVRVVTPLSIPVDRRDRVLINIHGGGFEGDWGSQTETIPIANMSATKVIAVLYRMAPEHPFPAAVDDVITVYRELLKSYRPAKIAIYGTSAGAMITAEVAARIKQLQLPMPAALGIFSGSGDLSTKGDSTALFGISGLTGHIDPPSPTLPYNTYVAHTNPKDPILSPIYSDLSGLPPTLFLSSTRDLLLSGTTLLHRAYLKAGVDARLVVFEALPHAFWNSPDLPESREAYEIIARFFDTELSK